MRRIWRRKNCAPLHHRQQLKLDRKSCDLGVELYHGLVRTERVLRRLICEIVEPALNGFHVIRIAVKLIRRPMAELTVHTSLLLELVQLAAQGARVQRRLFVLWHCSMGMASTTTM
ncbi:hypothetical protein PR003_g12958 [Phytophthora rubi]|uniref:Uncharacterized protein n=1 Tax=Phytophthora rubi TaxID=129364 RepID=A0A6A4F7T8_9STRA|nr:hypothetical protein PR003_g12958 [Phytophthora rubi]